MQLTPDQILTLSNSDWRYQNLYSIVDKRGERVVFTPNIIQKKIRANKKKRKMILKARQFGVSTGCIIDLFDWVCFTRNATAVIMAHEQDSIKKLFRIVARAYKFMPELLRPRLDRGGGSKYEYYFPDINSRIYVDLESRGDTIGRLHVSEAAFMKDSSKLKSTLQAVPIDGRVTIETTPNGMANHFFDDWTDPDSNYDKLFFPWYVYPDYKIETTDPLNYTEDELELIAKANRLFNIKITPEQIAFRRYKKAELKVSAHDQTKVTFEQEYPEDESTCFLSSGDAVMDLEKINQLLQAAGDPISDSGGLKVYRKPVKGRRYVIGADCAEGIKRDWSVGTVIDVEAFEVVAKIRGQWKPSEFAEKLNDLGKMYSSPGPIYPLLAVERNNHGHAVLLKLDEALRYPNLYLDERDERLGWRTDSTSRPIMINHFIDAIDDGHLKVTDKDILSECLTLIDNAGKIEASDGKHDDSIISCAIAIQISFKSHLSVYDDLKSKILL